MPIPLGVLAVAGAGAGPVAAGNAYEWLETTLLTSSQSSVSFANLDTNYGSTYQHLQIRIHARGDRTGADSDPIYMRFNSDSGSNYNRHGMLAYLSTSRTNNAGNSATSIYVTENMAVNQNASGIFGASIVDILDPFETTKNTTMRSLSGMYASGWQSIESRSGVWNNTAAISSILLAPLISSNFVSGSRFSLYGMRG